VYFPKNTYTPNKGDFNRISCPPGADISRLIYISRTSVLSTAGVRIQIQTVSYQKKGRLSVLFIHGWPLSHLMWKDQAVDHSLKHLYGVTLADMRGQGESSKPPPTKPVDFIYRPSINWANDIHNIITSRKLKNVVLVGHSFGGIIINDYIRYYGQKNLRGIVLVGGLPEINTPIAPSFESRNFKAILQARNIYSPQLEKQIPALRRFIEISTTCVLTNRDRDELLMYSMYCPPAVRQAIFGHEPGPFSTVWRSVKVPVLIIHGKNDDVLLFNTVVPYFKRNLVRSPRVTVVPFLNTGHMTPLEKPAKFNSTLLHFLNSIHLPKKSF
jgi:non-heme chloroperoxidase